MPHVDALHVKPHHGAAMVRQSSINSMAGAGIDGDISKNPMSPRQVLVVRREDLDTFSLNSGYLRENICVRDASIEDFRPGNILAFEGGARIFLGFNCEPCKTIAERVPNLKAITGKRGLLGIVIDGGTITDGEKCALLSSSFEKASDLPVDRVLAVIQKVPAGRVIDYSTILIAAGLQGPYYRVMPKYLQQGMTVGLPVHRVVDSSFRVPAVVSGMRSILENELIVAGIEIETLQANLFEISSPDGLPIPDAAAWYPNAIDLLKGSPSLY